MTDDFGKMFAEDFKKKGSVDAEGNLYFEGVTGKTKIGTIKDKKLEKEDVQIILRNVYEKIVSILKEYCDLDENSYKIVATWIIGTYMHDNFETYAYLFINAMRGSGKTRLLKLIAALSHNGELLTSLREAVLFRTAQGHTLCIDEFEGVNRKENEALRELLNACYKKGMKVKRMKKQGDGFAIDEFEPYTPICLANIWGMEEVLGDRCITLILEKSNNKAITKLIENYTSNSDINSVKSSLSSILVYLVQCSYEKKHTIEWNNYIKNKYNCVNNCTSSHYTYNTQTTQTTQKEQEELLHIFNKIDETGINGRHLELWFPLFLIGNLIDKDLFEDLLCISKEVTQVRSESELMESKDVSFIDFVANRDNDVEGRGWIGVKKLTSLFRDYLGEDDDDEKWINSKWVGRALKRLKLTAERRRKAGGMEVILAIDKAKEKIKMYRKEDVEP